jgi:hypothetical protein
VGPSTHVVHDGVAYQSGLSARWAWIVLPAAMALLFVLLLVTVLFRTARSAMPIWDGSPLIYLLFEVNAEIKRRARDFVDEYEGLDRAFGDMMVALDEGIGALRISKSVQSDDED